MKPLEAKLTKVWGSSDDWVLLEFLTFKPVHCEPLTICQLQFIFSSPDPGFHGDFCSWFSTLVSWDSLYLPYLSPQFEGQQFAVWSQFSDRYKKLFIVQSPACVQLFATPWTAALQVSLLFTISWSLLKLMSIESVMTSNDLILCQPLPLLPSIFPSIRVYSNESALPIRWPKYWSFSLNPSNEYSGLISFRIDWFDLLAVQGTLKSLFQYYNSKALILQCSAFLMVQHSHLYMTTGKTIALTLQTFVNKETKISLLFNMLSRFVIVFLLRSKCLNFTAAVTVSSDFGAQENKICNCFHFFPIYLSWSDGTGCHDLSFLNVEF